MTKRVLSIGQCDPDSAALKRFLSSVFPVDIERAATGPEAIDLLRKSAYDLVLVNRKLDIDYSDGMDIIRTMKADPQLQPIPIMLVSNYPEAQEEAVAAGAERGFGKAELGRSDVVARLEPFLGTGSAA